MRWRIAVLVLVAGMAFWLGRQSLSEIQELMAPAATPHEVYSRKLVEAGLAGSALGWRWAHAAETALEDAPQVELPFRQDGYLDPARPGAVAYRFTARSGERLRIEVEMEPASDLLLFLDLFRVSLDSLRAPARVISADSASRSLRYEPGRDGEFLVRVQPELLRGGRYTLRLLVEPTLAFPVHDGRERDIRSFFGDARDGGSRDHHGIDIFASRGTPVVAAAHGRVRSVRTTPIGGRVVWLRDEERGQSLYYAHLEEQWVTEGDQVRPGDTLGLVGNSGNARSTPPHLHFGIYRRGSGPVDPLPFVRPRPRDGPAPTLSIRATGGLRRVTSAAALRPAPSGDATEVGRLDADTPVRVIAIAGDWIRVEVGDGRRGFIAGRQTSVAEPMATVTLDSAAALRDSPGGGGVEVARLAPGASVEILGRLGPDLYVRAPGREAWLTGGLAR